MGQVLVFTSAMQKDFPVSNQLNVSKADKQTGRPLRGCGW